VIHFVIIGLDGHYPSNLSLQKRNHSNFFPFQNHIMGGFSIQLCIFTTQLIFKQPNPKLNDEI